MESTTDETVYLPLFIQLIKPSLPCFIYTV